MNLRVKCMPSDKKKPRPRQQKETECFVQDTMFIMDNNGVHKVE